MNLRRAKYNDRFWLLTYTEASRIRRQVMPGRVAAFARMDDIMQRHGGAAPIRVEPLSEAFLDLGGMVSMDERFCSFCAAEGRKVWMREHLAEYLLEQLATPNWRCIEGAPELGAFTRLGSWPGRVIYLHRDDVAAIQTSRVYRWRPRRLDQRGKP